MENGYENGKIYKIINENNDTIYIGSTKKTLNDRYSYHTHKKENHKIILIENYSCNSKKELCMREQEVIENHNNLVNKQRAYRSEEERKQELKIYNKNYKIKNKEELEEKKKIYNSVKKNEIKEYNKKQYDKNKNILNEKRKEKITCDICGSIIRKDTIIRHKKSLKCMNYNKDLLSN